MQPVKGQKLLPPPKRFQIGIMCMFCNRAGRPNDTLFMWMPDGYVVLQCAVQECRNVEIYPMQLPDSGLSPEEKIVVDDIIAKKKPEEPVKN